mmetsp:Transcript_3490/g.6673  ORF Transcript_3490/g.6673 Transcript_3490/m.6673 type:complete len:202 (+) Transcript_3490:787-1392(+)
MMVSKTRHLRKEKLRTISGCFTLVKPPYVFLSIRPYESFFTVKGQVVSGPAERPSASVLNCKTVKEESSSLPSTANPFRTPFSKCFHRRAKRAALPYFACSSIANRICSNTSCLVLTDCSDLSCCFSSRIHRNAPPVSSFASQNRSAASAPNSSTTSQYLWASSSSLSNSPSNRGNAVLDFCSVMSSLSSLETALRRAKKV